MIPGKSLFRRVLDSFIEGREREAQRYIAEYLKTRDELRRKRDHQ